MGIPVENREEGFRRGIEVENAEVRKVLLEANDTAELGEGRVEEEETPTEGGVLPNSG